MQYAAARRKDKANKDVYWLLNLSFQGGEVWRREADVLEMPENGIRVWRLWCCTCLAWKQPAEGLPTESDVDWP